MKLPDLFVAFCVCVCMCSGTLMELGISPIVTSSLIMQVIHSQLPYLVTDYARPMR